MGTLLFQELFDLVEVGLGVYADGVVRGGDNGDGDVVLEEAELLEALGELERGRGEGVEAVEGVGGVGVETDVLPDGRSLPVAGWFPFVGQGGSGKVEGAVGLAGDDLDGVRVEDVFGRAEDFESGDLGGGVVGERGEQGGEVLGSEERFVSLNVDVDGGGMELGSGVDAVGTAG